MKIFFLLSWLFSCESLPLEWICNDDFVGKCVNFGCWEITAEFHWICRIFPWKISTKISNYPKKSKTIKQQKLNRYFLKAAKMLFFFPKIFPVLVLLVENSHTAEHSLTSVFIHKTLRLMNSWCSQRICRKWTQKTRETFSCSSKWIEKLFGPNLFVGLFIRRLGRIILNCIYMIILLLFLVRRWVEIDPTQFSCFRHISNIWNLNFLASAEIWRWKSRKWASLEHLKLHFSYSNFQMKFSLIFLFNKKHETWYDADFFSWDENSFNKQNHNFSKAHKFHNTSEEIW